ncbi:MAG: cytochrome c family protein [Alphaproteobacteria bacterium]|nr:cytochrome c family protein [Alphaproteobacteria bacterium]
MDSFEWNKIAGAVLGTLMFVLVVSFVGEAVFEPAVPAKPGYVVEGVVEQTPTDQTSQAPAEEALPDWGTVLPAADAAAGQKISARCEQCHDLSKGGPDKIGPNLWGVLGRPRASRASFSYSSAMAASHDPWNFDHFFRFIKSPQAVVPGTKMSFAGIPNAKDRISLIAWLRTQSDSPLPVPPPQPAKAASDTHTPTAPQTPGSTPADNGKAPAAQGTKPATQTPAAAPKKPG